MRTVLVPGFSQTAASWEPVLAALGPDAGTVALDVPTGRDFARTAHALGEVGGAATYVGYSMGGRLCLRLALDRPSLVNRLVLVSTSPGIADAAERAARRAAEEELARRVEREGVDAFLRYWLAQPLFQGLTPSVARRGRLDDAPAIAHQLRALGQGGVEPMWGRLGELVAPVTLVTGSRDARYTETAHAMAERIPAASVTTLPGVGHAAHLEAPVAVASLLAA